MPISPRPRGQRILQAATAAAPADFRLRGEGALAKKLVRPERLADGPEWDAAIEEISVAALVADATIAVNGWLGPGWVRSGWFHAYRALGGAIRDATDKQATETRVARLKTADHQGIAERINLEREVVRSLTSDCHGMIAGYTVKREFFNTGFSSGVENISFDALEGLSSAMFLRTVKLKDFPWNGWLQLGIAAQPDSRVESGRGLHRSVRAVRLVCDHRSGRDTLALRFRLDAQPHHRCRGIAAPVKPHMLLRIGLLFCALTARAGIAAAQTQEVVFDLKIEKGRVGPDMRQIRVKQGDVVKLRWTTDRPIMLHLHGYDIETKVEPGKTADMTFTARATGRFPVEEHKPNKGAGHSHGEAPLVRVEVRPR